MALPLSETFMVLFFATLMLCFRMADYFTVGFVTYFRKIKKPVQFLLKELYRLCICRSVDAYKPNSSFTLSM